MNDRLIRCMRITIKTLASLTVAAGISLITYMGVTTKSLGASVYLTKTEEVQEHPCREPYNSFTQISFWDKNNDSEIDYAIKRKQVSNIVGVLSPSGAYELIVYSAHLGKPTERYFGTSKVFGKEAKTLLEKLIEENREESKKTRRILETQDPFYDSDKKFYWTFPDNRFHKEYVSKMLK